MVMPRAYRLLGPLVFGAAACSSFGTADTKGPTDAGTMPDTAEPDRSLEDADVADSFDGGADVALDTFKPDAAPRPPNTKCTFTAKTRVGMTFSYSQTPPAPGISFQVTVQEASVGFTNVELIYCSPDTLSFIRVQSAISLGGAPPFRWQFPTMTLPAGVTEIGFRADPGTTTYATTLVTVQ